MLTFPLFNDKLSLSLGKLIKMINDFLQPFSQNFKLLVKIFRLFGNSIFDLKYDYCVSMQEECSLAMLIKMINNSNIKVRLF